MPTFLVTGATGYIAKHIVQRLLNEGHTAIGSMRNLSRDTEVREAVAPGLPKGALERYRSVALDLGKDEGWDTAMNDVDVLMHTASPFPLSQPKDESEVIRPAVDGTLRALWAAKGAGIDKVVLTSSTVAVDGSGGASGRIMSEDDWTDTSDADASPYAKSKTLAERAAWDFIRDDAPEMRLTVINPSFVMGPALDLHYGTSLQVVERLVRSKDPAVPNFGFLCCDVRDVADAHVIAASTDKGEGGRHIITDGFLSFPEMAKIVDAALPDRKITTRVAPNMLVRVLSLFDSEIRQIVPILGRESAANNARMRSVLGLTPRSARDAVAETAKFLVSSGAVT